MARRFGGGYKSKLVRAERAQAPLLAIACEGQTEARYLQHLGRNRVMRMRPKVFPGHHGNQLVDDAVSYAEELQSRSREPAPVIHRGVIFDLERYTPTTISDAKETVIYASARGVSVWLSVPTIERWFLLHYAHIAASRSKRVVLEQLKSTLSTAGGPNYRKPGSPRFYGDLLPRSNSAATACRASHPSDLNGDGLTCICQLLEFLETV